jgi:hypothetical protein
LPNTVTMLGSLALAIVIGLSILTADAGRIGGGFGPRTTTAVQGVTFGTFAKYGNGACPATKCVSGDTWFSTWDDVGNIITTSDDSSAWNASSPTAGGSNLAIHKLSDFTPTMTGTLLFDGVTAPPYWYGPNTVSNGDGATWKASGFISVHGVYILSADRQLDTYTPPPVPNILASALYKSTDHGATWTNVTTPPSGSFTTTQPAACGGCDLGTPPATPPYTWVDPKFRWPFFVQYGQDYQGGTVDGSGTYVYAMSSDFTTGHTNVGGSVNGLGSDQVNLGRVPISAIANLNPSDWQYYQGGGNWGALSTAAPVISTPGQYHWGDTSSPVYLPAYGQYLMIMGDWGQGVAGTSVWLVLTAPHPWGPWTQIQSNSWTSPYYYYPAIIPSSIATDGGIHMVLLASGDFQTPAAYTLYIVQVTLF